MAYVIATVVAILVLAAVLIFRAIFVDDSSPELGDTLFSSEIRVFLNKIELAIQSQSELRVFTRVPVNEVISCSRIFADQVFDFVIVNRDTHATLSAIQLHSSDRKPAANKRLKELCFKAGLSMLQYNPSEKQDIPSIRRAILIASGIRDYTVLGEPSSSSAPTAPSAPEQNAAPLCPKCNASMKQTVIKKGAHAGKRCWVCSRYPHCKGAKLV